MTLSLPSKSPAYILEGCENRSGSNGTSRRARRVGARGTTAPQTRRKRLGAGDQFRNYYESGWGEKGRVLSPRALDAFFRFLEAASFPNATTVPSVFLTDRGGIELLGGPQRRSVKSSLLEQAPSSTKLRPIRRRHSLRRPASDLPEAVSVTMPLARPRTSSRHLH